MLLMGFVPLRREREAPPQREILGAMPEENVEIYRQALDAFNRRDRDAFLALCDPEIENVPPREWPESSPTRGPEAVWDFLVEGQAPWEEALFEAVEPIEETGDGVIVQLQGEMRGTASGAGVPWRYWHVATFHEGKALRFQWFVDRAEAFEAAGVRE